MPQTEQSKHQALSQKNTSSLSNKADLINFSPAAIISDQSDKLETSKPQQDITANAKTKAQFMLTKTLAYGYQNNRVTNDMCKHQHRSYQAN